MATVGQSGALRRVTVHYASSPTRGAVAAEVSLDDLDDELLQFVLADLLPGQEGLHQSILEGAHSSNQENHMRGAGSSAPYDYAQPQGYRAAESSTAATASRRNPGTDAQQIASDFEYAKQLQQEMEGLTVEDDDDDGISCVPSPSEDSDDGLDHHDEEEEADRQEGDGNGGGDDDDDPDNMTYEQRQALVESVGNEDRGLSNELISYLQPWKYKASGFFSRKTNHDDCPICLSTFRNRETMITLPCMHHYHAACVTKWLKVNKTCPVCKYEVFGPC